MKNKGGRPPYYKEKLLSERRKLIVVLLKRGYSKVEIADIFNVHPSQISRIRI